MSDKAGFFCRTYHKDADRLEYLLISIDRFAHGFEGITVVCPASSMFAIAPIVEKYSFASLRLCESFANDFIGQQITKFNADLYCEYEHIVHIDSDCVINKRLEPADLFQEGLPILYMAPYSYFYEKRL